jgi:hypothetical protein
MKLCSLAAHKVCVVEKLTVTMVMLLVKDRQALLLQLVLQLVLSSLR